MIDDDKTRLIENAFPLKQASLDSVHEKNVRHGHISTLHIWPARRPLAACRAALIATLMPDPGSEPKPEGMSEDDWQKEITRRRKALCEKIGGKIEKVIERKKMPNGQIVEREKEVTKGGILHWGRETENKADLDWFRQEIRKAYGGRAPKVLDPFAGGGSIPLEAMRLGCEATAVDINPVAWFILKCTLEYPQKLAGQTRPLPDFILKDRSFMEDFFKAKGLNKTEINLYLEKLGYISQESLQLSLAFEERPDILEADLAWHVRAWGRWVLNQARRELAEYYPIYAEFEPLDNKWPKPYEKQPLRLVPLKEDGTADIEALNAEFSEEYLNDKRNPRWVAKPTVAYLWARTVKCKNCRGTIPLLKTRWLCKKEKKRVLLTMKPKEDRSGVIFGIGKNVPVKGGNAAQRREHDKRIGAGTMTRSGVKCPCCGTIVEMDGIRIESRNRLKKLLLISVVIDGVWGKEYRKPTDLEIKVLAKVEKDLPQVLSFFPNLSIEELFSPCSTRSISAHLYGVKKWSDLYTNRQLLAISIIGKAISKAYSIMNKSYTVGIWCRSIIDYLLLGLDRLICFLCVNVRWKADADSLTDAFSRYSISLLWDFAEAQPLGTSAGSYIRCNDRIAKALDGLLKLCNSEIQTPIVGNSSATEFSQPKEFDLIITDPPYYESVSYADLSDFSYTWLRGLHPEFPDEFKEKLSNKELEIVQHIREDKDRIFEQNKYEEMMATTFIRFRENMSKHGRFVCVFAHKDPKAWETLASAIIRAGFVVIGSWPIQTEMPSRQRASSSSALASSVWLICKPRAITARPGWDNLVLEEMRQNIREKLHQFWDAGIRGPDFVWAATGPALEAFSKHPAVKKANEPGAVMTVGEFLTHVRRLVVEFVVGQVLSGDKNSGSELSAADRLDELTAYYLLHRHDFGLDEAPAGACILYAVSCGVSDKELSGTWDLITYSKGKTANEGDAETDGTVEVEEGSGSKIKLKKWSQRKGRSLGFEAPGGKPVPLIDRVHRLMHLWKAGDQRKVDEYIDENGLRRQELFKRLLQSLIELSNQGSEERSLLESLSNHIQSKGALNGGRQNSFYEKA